MFVQVQRYHAFAGRGPAAAVRPGFSGTEWEAIIWSGDWHDHRSKVLASQHRFATKQSAKKWADAWVAEHSNQPEEVK